MRKEWDLDLRWISKADIENEAAIAGFEIEYIGGHFSSDGPSFPFERAVILRRA